MNITQIKSALAQYVDEEFTNKMQGFKAILFGGGAALILNKLDAYVVQYQDMLVELGILSEDGLFDVDMAYNILKPQFEKKEKIVQDIPVIGAVTFTVADLDRLYQIAKSK